MKETFSNVKEKFDKDDEPKAPEAPKTEEYFKKVVWKTAFLIMIDFNILGISEFKQKL